MKAYSKEKKEIIQKFQDAVGNSKQRLIIIKNISKKESISELAIRLKIPQSTMSQAISNFKSYKLISLISKKGKSEIYDKISLLKTFSNLGSLVKIELKEENFEPKRIKRKINRGASVPFLEFFEERIAEDMAKPYTILYLLENSIRKFIDKRLTEKYGGGWWNKINVKTELKNRVSDRKKTEELNKWHIPRGATEIFYTDLTDLSYLFNKEDTIFKDEINLEYWTNTIKIVVSLSRNIIDHHNPLPKKEINRLKMTLDDWKKQFN